MLDDRRPVGDLAHDRLEGADHPRQQVLRGAEAVVADLVDAAAAQEQEIAAAGCARGAPARPTTSRRSRRKSQCGRMTCARAQARRQPCQSLVPRHFVEAVAAGALLALAPAVANCRPGDAQRRVHHCRDGVEHARRTGIACKRFAADHPAVLDQGGEGAPMGERGKAGQGHGVRCRSVSGDRVDRDILHDMPEKVSARMNRPAKLRSRRKRERCIALRSARATLANDAKVREWTLRQARC